MAYTTIDDPSAYFQCKIFTGTGNSLAITFDGNSDMQPDLVWVKARESNAYTNNHALVDVIRGVGKVLSSDRDVGTQNEPQSVTAFGSDGFTLGTSPVWNASSLLSVAWSWKAGTSFTNDASSTGIGTIDSAGSVSTDAGFSIVTFTGNSGSIAHGLAQKPAMIIIKPRNVSGSWIVTHKGLGAEMQDYYQFLDTTAAKATSNDIWGGEPTSTTFSVSSSLIDSANYVAYLFAEKKGYSKFSSYVGNGNADGTFIYTGFKPAMVILKLSSVAGENWYIFDNKRDTNNVMTQILYPNLNNAEATGTTNIDFLSNGFKLRNAGDFLNGSGQVHIYMAFAENPFVTSTGIPATAR